MNLKTYNRDNSNRRRDANPKVCVYPKTKQVTLSRSAINFFGIGEGGYVEFFHDEENNQWYIAKSSKPCGFKVAMNAHNFGSRDLVKRLAQDEPKHYLISTNTVEYGGYTCHPLIEVKNENRLQNSIRRF